MQGFRLSLIVLAVSGGVLSAAAQEGRPFALELESGAVFSGYNDVRIPGDTGTKFSLSKEIKTSAAPYARVRVSLTLRQRHTVSLLVAPLKLQVSGQVNRPVHFVDVIFPANTPLTGSYRFDSYRVTYRYTILDNERWTLGAGLTAKVRDAAIVLGGGGLNAQKRNTGFVPLVNFLAHWKFAPDWRVLLEGDALAAPQGRAEDVLAALRYNLSDSFSIQGGYRVLEGGADNDKVYNFALLNYAAVGLVYRPSFDEE